MQCFNDILINETDITSAYLMSPPRNLEITTSAMSIDDNSESNVGILKLSPLKRSLKDGDQYGILGNSVRTELNIGIHFGGNYIFSIERLMKHIA